MKHFNLKKISPVKEGKCGYEYDGLRTLKWYGQIKVGWGFLTKNEKREGELDISPSMLRSKNFEPGYKKEFEKLSIECLEANEDKAKCLIKLKNLGEGHCEISLKERFIEVLSGQLQVKVLGVSLVLELEPC